MHVHYRLSSAVLGCGLSGGEPGTKGGPTVGTSLRRWGAVAVMVALVAGVAGCSGTSRSEDAFCGELRKSAAALDAQTAGAGDDLGSQAAMILENLSDFNAMLHRLDDRAPDEIRSDMRLVVEAWDEQAEAMEDAADNPLGALSGALTNGIMAASSMEAVDRYAKDHCGRVIFGGLLSDGSGGGGGSGDGGREVSAACPDTPGSTPVLASDTTFSAFTSTLDGLKDIGKDVKRQVKKLEEAFDDLSPEPLYALEALGRLAFDGGSSAGAGGLAALDTAIEARCGRAAFGPALENLQPARPQRSGDRVLVGSSMYGTPCAGGGGMLSSGIEPAAPFSQLFYCPDAFVVVDLEDGTPRWFDVSQEAAGTIVDAGDRAVWLQRTEKPASGVNPVLTSVTLHIQPLDGDDPFTVPIVKDNPKPMADVRDDVVLAWRGRIVTLEEHLDESGSDLVVRDGHGKELARFDLEREGLCGDCVQPASSGVSDQQVAEGLLMLSSGRPSVALDIQAAKLVRFDTDDLDFVRNEVCWDRGFLYDFEPAGDAIGVRLFSGAPGVKVGGRVRWAYSNDVQLDVGVPRAGVVVVHPLDGGLQGRGTDGRVLWTIGSDVAANWEVIGGWVRILNRSDQAVIVDPTTGKEATGLSSDVTDALAALAQNTRPDGDETKASAWMHDSGTGKLTIAAGEEMWQVPLSEICP